MSHGALGAEGRTNKAMLSANVFPVKARGFEEHNSDTACTLLLVCPRNSSFIHTRRTMTQLRCKLPSLSDTACTPSAFISRTWCRSAVPQPHRSARHTPAFVLSSDNASCQHLRGCMQAQPACHDDIQYVCFHMADVVTAMWPEILLIWHPTEVGGEMLWLDGAASH